MVLNSTNLVLTPNISSDLHLVFFALLEQLLHPFRELLAGFARLVELLLKSLLSLRPVIQIETELARLILRCHCLLLPDSF